MGKGTIIKKAAKKIADRRPSTPAQRAFGGGRRIGTRTGRVEGAAVGTAATGLTMAALSNMSLQELRTAKRQAESEAQRAKIQAAIEKELRKLASTGNMKGGNTRGTSPKPKLRPQAKAKGGAVKLSKGGASDPAWLKAMKKEADKLGVPLRELLTKYNGRGGPTTRDKYGPQKPKSKGKKASMMKAAKGGYSKMKKK